MSAGHAPQRSSTAHVMPMGCQLLCGKPAQLPVRSTPVPLATAFAFISLCMTQWWRYLAGVKRRARPMSATQGRPAALMKTLEGLRSRCRMGGSAASRACMPCATPSAMRSFSLRLRLGPPPAHSFQLSISTCQHHHHFNTVVPCATTSAMRSFSLRLRLGAPLHMTSSSAFPHASLILKWWTQSDYALRHSRRHAQLLAQAAPGRPLAHASEAHFQLNTRCYMTLVW